MFHSLSELGLVNVPIISLLRNAAQRDHFMAQKARETKVTFEIFNHFEIGKSCITSICFKMKENKKFEKKLRNLLLLIFYFYYF